MNPTALPLLIRHGIEVLEFRTHRAGIPSLIVAGLLLVIAGPSASAQMEEAAWPDERLQHRRNLRDAYHPWKPASSRKEWERQRQEIRERILISTGLWPMPRFTPLEPVIHGAIARDGYTVERVFFESIPGLLVSGNLYRPAGPANRRYPGILSPHGHWNQGRFYDAGPQGAEKQLATDAEQYMSAARYPLQARMAELARRGYVVFHYDMIGYADSQPLDHRQGFSDLTATLWQQNLMGLQTLNSLRALDFLAGLPDVDSRRIGVTGASGGGTQTFILCAIDERPAAAFPAVMVSTAMQGGCVCENAPYLRIGVNNIAFAAAGAPRPLAMSGADDWTIDIETRGLPELKRIYSLYEKETLVAATCYRQFPHNYNLVARQMMYDWFRTHLQDGKGPSGDEQELEPVPPAELSVFNDDHPIPAGLRKAVSIREYLQNESSHDFQERLPGNAEQSAEFTEFMRPVNRVLLDAAPPAESDLREFRHEPIQRDNLRLLTGQVGRRDGHDAIPYEVRIPSNFNGHLVLSISEGGIAAAWTNEEKDLLLKRGFGLASADIFLTGTSFQGTAAPKVEEGFPGYTFGYNRPLISDRIRDIATLIRAARRSREIQGLHLFGRGSAGLWVLLASASADGLVDSVVADLNDRTLGQVESVQSPDLLPGALKYGGIGGLAGQACPTPVVLFGVREKAAAELKPMQRIYDVQKASVVLHSKSLDAEQLTQILVERIR